jgi:hypothetical protein
MTTWVGIVGHDVTATTLNKICQMLKGETVNKLACLLCVLLCFPMTTSANDYPTQARVEYVLGCMNERGGQSYDTLYGCVCSIDKIAEGLPYERYVEAETFGVMVKTPGERGGAFRDAPGARGLLKQFAKLKESAETSCFVKRVGATSKQ